MPRRWQYPIYAIGPETLGDPETVKVEQWAPPWSTPAHHLTKSVVFAAALIAASGIAPIDPDILNDPEESKVEQWWQPWPAVLPLPRYQHPATFDDPEGLGEVAAAADTSTEWLVPWSSPVFLKPHPAQRHFVTDEQTIGDAETVKFEHWWAPWPEKIWPKPALSVSLQQHFITDPEALGDAEIVKVEQWLPPWSEPVLPIPRYQHQASFDDPEGLGQVGIPDDTSFEWFTMWQDRVFPRPAFAVSAQLHFVTDPEELGAVGPIVADSGTRRQRQIKSLTRSRRRR